MKLPAVLGVVAVLGAAAGVNAAETAGGGATAPATQGAVVTREMARAELRAVLAKAIAECRAVAEQAAQQQKGAEEAPGGDLKWRPAALPGTGDMFSGSKRMSRCAALEGLTERLNKASERGVTEELRAYGAAAAECLDDEDPGRRGMACAFLGLLGPHAAELGLLPGVAGKLSDRAVAIRALQMAPARQQVDLRGERDSPKAMELTVGELAQMALAAATNWRFEDGATFKEWWEANGDYEARLWYWALRWSRQGHVEADLPGMFARDAKTGLSILVLAASSNCLEAEGHHPWPDFRVAGGRALPRTISSVYFAPPSAAVVAALVAKYGLRAQLEAMAVGDVMGRDKVPDYDREELAVTRIVPLLAAASTKADAAEIRGLLKNGTGLAGASARVQVALARVAGGLDPENAERVRVEQLGRNAALPSLAADLVAQTGVKHWDLVKASYTHAPAGDEEGTAALLAAVAALAPAEARGRLAELLAADPLEVTLDDAGNPTEKSNEKQRRFGAMVQAAQTLHGGKAVLEESVVDQASAYVAFKVPQEGRAAFVARNRAAVGNRQQAVRALAAFFGGAGG